MTCPCGGTLSTHHDNLTCECGGYVQTQTWGDVICDRCGRTLEEVSAVGDEWLDEPNDVAWEAHGLPCKIHRTTMGHLCGYVGVKEGHPAHGHHYFNIDVTVHGGLTFGEYGEKAKFLSPGYYWLGFDCAHLHDVSPEMVKLYPRLKDPEASYKNIRYVTHQTERLAKQLSELTTDSIETGDNAWFKETAE